MTNGIMVVVFLKASKSQYNESLSAEMHIAK